jgi:hypothetical protein
MILTENASAVAKRLPGAVGLMLRVEGALVFALAVWAYYTLGGNWWVFALLFLAPDLFMLGYLRGNEVGARVYNAGHTYLVPAALGLVGVVLGFSALLPIAIIWAAHIGFDRLLGYGLKDPSGFKVTHLG